MTALKISIFLDKAGKSLWQTEDEDKLTEDSLRDEYLEPNGIVASSIHIDEQTKTAWIHVDTHKTRMSDFYTWDEAAARPDKPECWRDFYFFWNEHDEAFWSPQYVNSPDAEIQGLGNVQSLLQKIKAEKNAGLSTKGNIYVYESPFC